MKLVAIALLTGIVSVPVTAHAQSRTPIPNPVLQTPAAGVAVLDTAGAPVGTIESVTGDLAVINTGTNKVSYPVASMTPAANGAIIALTKAQLDASFVEQQAKAKADLQARMVAGTAVFANDGTTQIAVIKSVGAEFVTVTAPNGKDANGPVSGFALGRTGVVTGISVADFAKATAGA